jgi:hypothetical protein
VVHIPSLPQRDRLVLAELSGTAVRYGTGHARDTPRDEAIAAVHAVSTDPRLLGITAGSAMADPRRISDPVVELLRAAGADMDVAAEHAAEVRERLRATGVQYVDED